MKTRAKVIIALATTVLVVAGLFVLRAYYADKLGIFADVLTDEKIIASKSVADGDFDTDHIVNMTRPEGQDYYSVQTESNEICGSYPGDTDISAMPDGLNFSLALTEALDPESGLNIANFNENYYVGNQNYTQSTGTYPLKPAGDNPEVDDPGFSIVRGPGWLRVELDEPPTGYNISAVKGSITLPPGTSLNSSSLVFTNGGVGLENIGDGIYTLNSDNDEVTINSIERTIEFTIATGAFADTFTINYCFSPVSTYEGSISGQVDIGSIKPVTSLKLNVIDYSASVDQISVTTEISKNGIDWFPGAQSMGLQNNLQSDPPRDSFCFRYIKYSINFKTSTNLPSELVKLRGMDIYGGDLCGSELAFDPSAVTSHDTACSNGIDDDSDGKIDFSATATGDQGCSSFMDDDETDPVKICRDGANANISLTVNIDEHVDNGGLNLGGNIYVGADALPKTTPATIQLVSDGIAVKDTVLQDNVIGLSVFRGEGYIYLHHGSQQTNYAHIRGNLKVSGSDFTKFINHSYEISSSEDSFSIPDNDDSSAIFSSKVGLDSDGIYIYYDYTPAITGGCQCQDGLDNDNNGLIDYPDDFGCLSPTDNTELPSNEVAQLFPACKNGLDDDGDGKVDYPEDTGCESLIDDSEDEPVQLCKMDTSSSATLRFSEVTVSNTAKGDLQDRYYVGDQIYASEQDIPLIENGLAIVDTDIKEFVPGVSIKRGPGYVYLLFQNSPEARGYEYFNGKMIVEGAKIVKAINGSDRFSNLSPLKLSGPFDSQGDNIADTSGTNSLQDEFTVHNQGSDNYVSLVNTTGSGSDSVYVYYEYTDIVSGCCQCQDGRDNDGDGAIDYPSDRGCNSLEDDDETDSIVALVSQPQKVFVSVISSGPGFWVLIASVLVISGLIILMIVKPKKISKSFKRAIKIVAVLFAVSVAVYLFLNFRATYEKITYTLDPESQRDENLLSAVSATATKGSDTRQNIISDELSDGWLSYPRFGIKAPILWDIPANQATKKLTDGLVHIADTSKPGENGEILISGHSSYYWWHRGQYNTVFANLSKSEIGDKIIIRDKNIYVYSVVNKFQIGGKDSLEFKPWSEEKLTLMTCVPLGTNLRRLIVEAKLESII